jgi:3-methyladenine DNA glycosylase AlkD
VNILTEIRKEIRSKADPQKAKVLQGFFKTGKGEYGEGDIFLGLVVPESRKIASMFKEMSLNDIEVLLQSKIHEERLIALLILVQKFEKEEKSQKDIYNFYLNSTKYINNWDLVDLSAEKIIGPYLLNRSKSVLYKLAKSKNIWERRISVLTTFHFIKNNNFDDTLKVAAILIKDNHDLIHKAVGWMLREVGKRDLNVEEEFLKLNYKKMPRTILRYAIEKFPENKRKAYLSGKI